MFKDIFERQPPYPKNYGCKYFLDNEEACALAGCQAEVIIDEVITEFEGNVEARQERIEEITKRAKKAGCLNYKSFPKLY